MRKLTAFAFTALLGLGPLAAGADFDGSKPLLCAVTEAMECGPLECLRLRVETLDLPRFLRIDFDDKRVSGRAPDGAVRSTKIENLQKLEGATVLQGVELRAWSLLIRHDTGSMTLTASGADAGFVVFGACTTP